MKPKEIIQLARENRKNPTSSEELFWKYLRNRQIEGKKFLRQYPIAYHSINGDSNYFIADFYCHEKRLIIELDGRIHANQRNYDNCRDEILSERGYKVLRINNKELANMNKVLNKIRSRIL